VFLYDDKGDDDDDDEEEDEDGEELSAEEIRSLISGRTGKPLTFIGDEGLIKGVEKGTRAGMESALRASLSATNEQSASQKKSSVAPLIEEVSRGNRGEDSAGESEEISVEDVFKSLSGRKAYVTSRDLKGWDYIQDCMQVSPDAQTPKHTRLQPYRTD
jgi:hypothetical protein